MGKLTNRPCANQMCTGKVVANEPHNLCFNCAKRLRRDLLPVAGFISSLDLRSAGDQYLREVNPTKAEKAEALRLMRGPRYREGGPWDERPAYRVAPLVHGRSAQRLRHILIGRRRPPSITAIGMAIAHGHLAKTVLGTGRQYNLFLSGATYFNRRGMSAPTGADVLTGGMPTAGYRPRFYDFTGLGLRIERASERLGINPGSRAVTDRITDIYHTGLAAGDHHPPVLLDRRSQPTAASGDHLFDHWVQNTSWVPAEYRNKVRRVTGRIGRAYPVGLDVPIREIAARRSQPTPRPTPSPSPAAPLSTEWLGF